MQLNTSSEKDIQAKAGRCCFRVIQSTAVLAAGLLALTGLPSRAEEAHEGKSSDEVARELTNPASSLSFLTMKHQFRIYDGNLPGASDQWNYTFLFQPVFPFPMGETSSGGKSNIFVRPAFPLLGDQPIPALRGGNLGYDTPTGFGDIGFDLAYGVTEKSGFIWIVGMVGTLPTASDSRFAGKQLRLGPEMFIGHGYKWGLIGVLPQHQWDVAGWGDNYSSLTQIQPVLNVNLGKGWVVGTQPMIQYDWRQGQWTVPINFQVSKTVQLGKLPLRVQLEADYYIGRSNAFAPEWLIGVNITPVVPNFINSWLRGSGKDQELVRAGK
jgi:hypothetical protein